MLCSLPLNRSTDLLQFYRIENLYEYVLHKRKKSLQCNPKETTSESIMLKYICIRLLRINIFFIGKRIILDYARN